MDVAEGEANTSSDAVGKSGAEGELVIVDVITSAASTGTSSRLSEVAGGPAKAPVSGVAGVEAMVGDDKSDEETATSSKLVPASPERELSVSAVWRSSKFDSGCWPRGTPAKKKPMARISRAIA